MVGGMRGSLPRRDGADPTREGRSAAPRSPPTIWRC